MTIFLLVLVISILLLFSIYVLNSNSCGFLALFFVIYHLVFMFFPALIHLYIGVFPFYDFTYDEHTQLVGAQISLLFIVSFIIGYFLKSWRKKHSYTFQEPVVRRSAVLFFVLIVYVFLELALFWYLGIDAFLVKRSEVDRDSFNSVTSAANVILLFSRKISFASLFLVFYFRFLIRNKYLRWVVLFVVLSLFLVFNYPLALPRFELAAYIIFFVVFFYGPTRKIKTMIFCGAVAGVTTIFPFLSYVTRGKEGDDFQFGIVDYYTSSGDFDGFQSLLNVIEYVQVEGLQYGQQLLGAIFILVPRSMWEAKAVSTGTIAAEVAGYQFTNVSSPLISEFYIDFGVWGVGIGALILGYTVRVVDLHFFDYRNKTLISLFIIASIYSLTIILLRGSLIGVMAHLYIQVLVFLIPVILSRSIFKR